jgi:hypothetical protein
VEQLQRVTPDGKAHLQTTDGRWVEVTLGDVWWDLDLDPEDGPTVCRDDLIHSLTLVDEDPDAFDFDFIIPGLELEVERARAAHEQHVALGIVRSDLPGALLASELRSKPEPEHDWLVGGDDLGLERLGGVTIIAGREKLSGKSTLVFGITRALERGEATPWGPALDRPVRTVLLTEEPEYSIREKCEDFDLGDGLLIVSNHDVPGSFADKLAAVGRYVEAFEAQRFIIDPISRIAGIKDETGPELGLAVEPIAALARSLHVSAVVIHHANKRADAGGEMDRFRGSTSLTAAGDALVFVEKKQPKLRSRSRWLTSWGRVRALNWDRVITLGDDNRTYEMELPEEEVGPDSGAQMLALMTLGGELAAAGPSTVRQLLERRGDEPTSAAKAKLRKQLDKLAAAGRATVTKGEHQGDPHVYEAAVPEGETEPVTGGGD